VLAKSRERRGAIDFESVETRMEFDEHAVKVSSGDTLFVYTDGLTDRRNAAGDFYSIDRIAALLGTTGDLGAVYEAIYDDVRGFAATDDFKDDIAFVVTRFE